MKKVLFLIVPVLISALLFTGCSDIANLVVPNTNTEKEATYIGKSSCTICSNGGIYTEENPFIRALYAGHEKNENQVGEVWVWNDDMYLYVRYLVWETWFLTETHLHSACDKSKIPQTKKGNPIPGKFDYKASFEFSDEVTEKLFSIPLEKFNDCCNCVIAIAAHAVVKNIDPCIEEETAWADCASFNPDGHGNWSTYFDYCYCINLD